MLCKEFLLLLKPAKYGEKGFEAHITYRPVKKKSRCKIYREFIGLF
jgi:hypothetical protein